MTQELPPDLSGSGKKVSSLYLWVPLALAFFVMGWLLHQHYSPQDVEQGRFAPEPVTTENDYERTVTLLPDRQGHYVFAGYINGKKVNFLLDTGSTSVAVPESLAQYLGLWKRGEMTVVTANGNAKAYATRIDQVRVGDIAFENVGGTILPAMQGDEVLLGMSFLRQLRMMQQGKNLQLVQKIDGSIGLPWDNR